MMSVTLAANIDQEVFRLRETVRLHNIEAANARENYQLSQDLFKRNALSLDQVRALRQGAFAPFSTQAGAWARPGSIG